MWILSLFLILVDPSATQPVPITIKLQDKSYPTARECMLAADAVMAQHRAGSGVRHHAYCLPA